MVETLLLKLGNGLTSVPKNRIKTVYVELWDKMGMCPYCLSELVQSGQKYDPGGAFINRNGPERTEMDRNGPP